MELGGSLPHSQESTTFPYRSQINPFLCPSHFLQAQLVSFLVGLRTYQHPGITLSAQDQYATVYNKVLKHTGQPPPPGHGRLHHHEWQTVATTGEELSHLQSVVGCVCGAYRVVLIVSKFRVRSHVGVKTADVGSDVSVYTVYPSIFEVVIASGRYT